MHPSSAPALTLLALMSLSSLPGPSPTRPAGVPAQEAPKLADLAFMTGCWNGDFRARDGRTGTIEEHYTSTSENVMLGTTRYLLDGRAIQFELTTILADSAGVTFLPYPRGRASPDGFLFTTADRNESGTTMRAVFEAPEHDFPKRIIYRREGDRLFARADGGEGSDQVQEWTMAAAPCH